MWSGLEFELAEESHKLPRVKVIGIGQGGCNAVAHMYEAGLAGVEFYAVNTDAQALSALAVPNKILIGSRITKGLGTGGNPELGREAALEETDRLVELLGGADMVFLFACFGGGTGTGATPVVASLARQLGILTVAVVTRPFSLEGSARVRIADQGIAQLAGTVDTIITLANDRLFSLMPENTGFFEAMRRADEVLRQAVEGISDIITSVGYINRDLADIRAIMSGMGHAVMGTGLGRGEQAVIQAVEAAISSPLVEQGGLQGAKAVLLNISGSARLGLHDIARACQLVREATGNEDVDLKLGVVRDEQLGDAVKVTLIATGFARPTGTDSVSNSAVCLTQLPRAEELARTSPLDRIPDEPPLPVEPGTAAPLVEARPTSTYNSVAPEDLDKPAIFRRERKLFS